MPQIDREGIFKVAAAALTAVEQAESGAVCAVLKFQITDMLVGGQWEDWTSYGYDVYARLYFVKKNNGGLHQPAIENMRDVLGWDGVIESISTGTWQTPACQVTVKNEPYDGKDSYRVSFINPIDYAGGLRSANPDALAKISSLYGSQLLALCSAKPTAPARPPGRPGLPPAPKKAAAPGSTKEDAWKAFCDIQATNPKYDDEFLAQEWHRIGSEMFGERFVNDSLTPVEWLTLKNEGPRMVLPF